MLARVKVDEFNSKVLEADKPVVVDFGAEWCGPCRALEPILEKLAEKHKGRFEFYSANADEVGDIMFRFKFFSLPTVALFRQGKLIGTVVGVSETPEADIEALLHRD